MGEDLLLFCFTLCIQTYNIPVHKLTQIRCAYDFSYRVEVSGGLGHTAGKIWRVGLMGYNARPDIVDMFLRVFREALQKQGYNFSKM